MIKKVCHITRRFTLDQWGGTESSVLNVSSQLQQRGIESIIYSTDMFESEGDDAIDGVPVRRYSYTFPWLFLSDDEKAEMELRGGSPLSLPLMFSLLKEKDLSIIHTHVHGRLGGIARTVAKWRRIPYILSIHAGYLTLPESHSELMRRPFKNKFEWGKAFGFAVGARKTLQDAAGIICVGKDEYEVLSERHPDKKVFYLPNGVDSKRFSEADGEACRKRFGFSEDDHILLCVSRIDEQKNQTLLVSAFAEYAERYPDARLLLIGPVTVESYCDEIRSLAKQLGVGEKVTLVPGLTPHDPVLASAFKAADQFILPSRVEPFGIVVLEAWSAGLPVIASRVGGIPGFTRNRGNALLFPSENKAQLLSAMCEVREDRELRDRLVQNGHKEVVQYDWETITDRLLEIYEEVLPAKGRFSRSYRGQS